MKPAFEVDAINNEFEVLAKSLGIADCNDHERSRIEVLGKREGISRFRYDGQVFSVARKALLPDVKSLTEFNSNLYAIKKETL
jgi:hypothetical protein